MTTESIPIEHKENLIGVKHLIKTNAPIKEYPVDKTKQVINRDDTGWTEYQIKLK